MPPPSLPSWLTTFHHIQQIISLLPQGSLALILLSQTYAALTLYITRTPSKFFVISHFKIYLLWPLSPILGDNKTNEMKPKQTKINQTNTWADNSRADGALVPCWTAWLFGSKLFGAEIIFWAWFSSMALTFVIAGGRRLTALAVQVLRVCHDLRRFQLGLTICWYLSDFCLSCFTFSSENTIVTLKGGCAIHMELRYYS